MSFLFNWFKAQPAAPERVPTDTVIPLWGTDDNPIFRAIAIHFSMRFDDELDVEKLMEVLRKLLNRPGWKRLGARLRLNKDNRLEYHVPAEYTISRPSFAFTHVTYDMPINEHPEASQMPRSSDSMKLGPNASRFGSLVNPPNAPTKMEDWIYSDRPQLLVHVVSFQDATLVTLSWLHTLFDAMGRSALLRAWQAMLEGREHDIPEVFGYDFDALAPLGAPESSKLETAPEEFVLKDKALSLWQLIKFGISFAWEQFMYPHEDMRLLCMPPSFFAKLKQSALNDLKTADPTSLTMNTTDPANPKPFLSDGDVLGAWWLRILVSNQPWVSSASPSKTILFMNVFGMRELLTNTEPKLLPEGVAYVANAANAIYTFFSLSELLSLPLGHLAARIRKDLTIQTTRAQVNASSRLARVAFRETGRPLLYGSSDMMIMNFTNWTKGKMFETDFSSAVVTEGRARHRRGRPSYVQAVGSSEKYPLRNGAVIVGKDWEGNLWLGGCARLDTWSNMEKAVEGL